MTMNTEHPHVKDPDYKANIRHFRQNTANLFSLLKCPSTYPYNCLNKIAPIVAVLSAKTKHFT